MSLFLGILAATWLFGCRAFEPEAVIVNKPPETYIIGSPAETTGAYFHYHVYWYGTDDDGVVERFVWALTDTSIQNSRLPGDEEDQNFNPATNISTLSRAHWTTRSDSIFDFRINQGSSLSADMTLHMVAQDDRGDYDRTPARLHFFSNALGHPRIIFYKDVIGEGNEFANGDTIAYRQPLTLRWRGRTPNTTAYDLDLLARADTVPRVLPPGQHPDGLLGFKWYVPEQGCDPSREGCWSPRRERETGSTDSVSFFADTTSLTFYNDGRGTQAYGRVLPNGPLNLLVNTIDVAGVQIPLADQTLSIIVNYDPDTRLLRGELGPDGKTYPYYVVFHGSEAGEYTFAEGDTVPDGAYAVFMAEGWDDRRDAPWDPCPPGNPECENNLRFQASFEAVALFGGTRFNFAAPYGSGLHQTDDPGWTIPHDPYAVSRDTVSFEVGPFAYDFAMRAVDKHGRRDGTPDRFRFQGNFPPCVQCVELLNPQVAPTVAYEDACYDHECLDGISDLIVSTESHPESANHLYRISATDTMWVDADHNFLRLRRPVDTTGYRPVLSNRYSYVIYLHGKNPPQEAWPAGAADRRVGSWYYQVDYDGDPGNMIRDGSGNDAILSASGLAPAANQPDPLGESMFIDVDESHPYRGAWGIPVVVGVPVSLVGNGPQSLWDSLLSMYGAPDRPASPAEICAWQQGAQVQQAYSAWYLVTIQFTPGTVRAVAADGSTCQWRHATNAYHYYEGLRRPSGNHGRECDVHYGGDGIVEAGYLEMQNFPVKSNRGEPVTKQFQITVRTPQGGDFQGGGDPPGWLPCGKRVAKGWR